jgi:hypothetical protein
MSSKKRTRMEPSLDQFAIDAPVQEKIRKLSLETLREMQERVFQSNKPEETWEDEDWDFVHQVEAEIAIRQSIFGEFELSEEVD